MGKAPTYAVVAVDAAIKQPLTYMVPTDLKDSVEVGRRVIVPLGKRKVTGYVVAITSECDLPEKSLKPIISLLDEGPLVDGDMMDLLSWAARYYFVPISEAIKAALPAGINVASRKSVCITDYGKNALSGGELRPTEADFLARLDDAGNAPLDKSGGCPQLDASPAMIKKLEKRGLIEKGHKVSDARVKEKSERAVEILRTMSDEEFASLKRRAPEQARLVQSVSGKGPVTLRELRSDFKDPSRLAKILEGAGLVKIVEVKVSRDPFAMELELSAPPEKLMPEQEESVKKVAPSIKKSEFEVFLLQGVTGSGKTEVYLRLIEENRKRGRSAIMLVPEIALTPQLVSRFRQRFSKNEIAVLHSGLSQGERFDEWWRIKRGEATIIIGARSAVFAPVKDPGIIIVDEEQESAYKQDSGFMYSGRDMAIMRAKKGRAVAILGSATPSMESARRAREEGGYSLLTLTSRVDNRPLPKVQVVDMRTEPCLKPEDRNNEATEKCRIKDRDRLAASDLISSPLRDAIRKNLEKSEQTILFINRRGSASFLICLDCGRRFTCPSCDVSLVHHRMATARKVDDFFGEPAAGGYLLCHHCGFHMETPELCPDCRGVRVQSFASGTEQIESAVSELFPEARVLRMDSDSMSGKKAWFECIDSICKNEVDIVVGTQMVAKGHDLPNVTLVGVLLADISMNLPEFRASERTFQMLTQVAGRAGRGQSPGRVIVQTFQPENTALMLAVEQDFDAFYDDEAGRRQVLSYPPFSRLSNFRIQGMPAEEVKKAAKTLGAIAKRKANTRAFRDRVRILGPAPAPIGRIKGKTRWMMLVKADDHSTMSYFCETVMNAYDEKEKGPKVKVQIDRDPVFLM